VHIAKTLLLAGAGLTKDFGGFLASEMWSAIFNQPEIREDNTLRQIMLRGPLNYESIYHEVQSEPAYPDAQKTALARAIRRAYDEMDQIVYQRNTTRPIHSAYELCRCFITRFAPPNPERSFFFTLNQDLLIERFFSNSSSAIIQLPGLHHEKWFNGRLGEQLDTGDFVTLPDERQVEQFKRIFWNKGTGNFVYVKLHGSYGWMAKDSSEAMVIGHEKTGMIARDPLLAWYSSLFEQVLHEGDRNLLVIGYGFGDEHINSTIKNAICNSGLKLFVISPKAPEDFRRDLCGVSSCNKELKPHGQELWNGLHGYFSARVTDFYVENHVQLPPRGAQFFRTLIR
jgi:hypothetical protein